MLHILRPSNILVNTQWIVNIIFIRTFYMSDQHTTVQYQLRLPQELRDQIKESAARHSRSMNADIVARLEESFNAKSEVSLESKYDALYKEYKINQKMLHDISSAVLKLKESVDNDDANGR